MKFCIISDLHCTEKKGNSSLFYSDIPDRPVNQNPISSILQKIGEDNSIHSEVVLCLGDLGDRAYKQGIKSAWEAVFRIKNEMGAKILIGIPGNHDIDSRSEYSEKPFEYIKNFHTSFPTSNYNLNNDFWSNGYCIFESVDVEILMINSVVGHKDEISAKISEISQITLEAIERDLKNESVKTKICILHHHPIKHSNIENWKDNDSLERGDKLIEILNRYNYDIVIHGHKHQPRVVDQGGLTIFATGSFSSFENLQGTAYKTMFHILNIESKGKGKILSWEFNIHNGWGVELNRFFPPEIGFGERGNLDVIASKINKIFKDNSKDVYLYEDLKLSCPELEYILPEGLSKLDDILKNKYNLFTDPQFPLKPTIVILK